MKAGESVVLMTAITVTAISDTELDPENLLRNMFTVIRRREEGGYTAAHYKLQILMDAKTE